MPNLDRRSDWRKVSFGDVVTHIKDRVQDVMACGLQEYIRGEHFEPASLRLIGRSTLGDGKHGSAFCMRFRPGDVLYVSRNPQLRKTAVVDFEGICANTTYVCRANNEYLLQELLPFIMQTESFVEHTIRHKRGSTNFYLNWSDIACYDFALPPLEEQRRIAGLMLKMEGFLIALTDLVDSLQIAKTAMFEELVRSKNPATVPLGDLLLCSPRNGVSPKESHTSTGHHVLALSAISTSGYIPDQLKPVKMSPALQNATLHPGDLVISRSNTRELVGLPAVFPEDRTDISYPDTMMRLSFDKESVDSNYIEMCLRIPSIRREVQSYAAGTSSSMKKINGTNLCKVGVPVISLAQQEDIVAAVKKIDCLIRNTQVRRSNALSLKSKMLADCLEVGVNAQ